MKRIVYKMEKVPTYIVDIIDSEVTPIIEDLEEVEMSEMKTTDIWEEVIVMIKAIHHKPIQ